MCDSELIFWHVAVFWLSSLVLIMALAAPEWLRCCRAADWMSKNLKTSTGLAIVSGEMDTVRWRFLRAQSCNDCCGICTCKNFHLNLLQGAKHAKEDLCRLAAAS